MDMLDPWKHTHFNFFYFFSNMENSGSTKRDPPVSFFKSLTLIQQSTSEKLSLTICAISQFKPQRLENRRLSRNHLFAGNPRKYHVCKNVLSYSVGHHSLNISCGVSISRVRAFDFATSGFFGYLRNFFSKYFT